jgi:hypothetical protein
MPWLLQTSKQTTKKRQNSFPDKLVIPHITKMFFEFYGTRKFSTVFTTGPYPEPEEARRQPRMLFI